MLAALSSSLLSSTLSDPVHLELPVHRVGMLPCAHFFSFVSPLCSVSFLIQYLFRPNVANARSVFANALGLRSVLFAFANVRSAFTNVLCVKRSRCSVRIRERSVCTCKAFANAWSANGELLVCVRELNVRSAKRS